MGTKTADETGAEAGAEATTDEKKVDVTKTDEVTGTEATEGDATAADVEDTDTESAEDADIELLEAAAEVLAKEESEGSAEVGQGAGAVVSAALGLVSLTGGWIGTVASARETLKGQLETASSASVATQVKEIYGDAWQTSALWAGFFALAALIAGVVVLARPAFGTPGKPQAVWIKSVAWGGVALGVIGLLLAVLKYTDVLLGLPSTS